VGHGLALPAPSPRPRLGDQDDQHRARIVTRRTDLRSSPVSGMEVCPSRCRFRHRGGQTFVVERAAHLEVCPFPVWARLSRPFLGGEPCWLWGGPGWAGWGRRLGRPAFPGYATIVVSSVTTIWIG
jgi:hypothetical protein